MNSTSYMFSFVLGLIVVLVFVVVLNSRFHFVDNLFNAAPNTNIAVVSPTPTRAPNPTAAPTGVRVAQVRPSATTAPTRTPTRQPTQTPQNSQNSGTAAARPTATATPRPTTIASASDAVQQGVRSGQVRGVTQIPNTGFPTLALPLVGAALYVGSRLRKIS